MLRRLIRALVPKTADGALPAPARDPCTEEVSRGASLLSSGHVSDALVIAESVADAFPDRAAPLVLAAECLLKLGRPDEAERRALAALRKGARDVRAFIALAHAYVDQGLHEDAILAMSQGEEREPQDATYWNEYGVLHLKLGNLDHAEVRFRRASILAPGDPAPWVNLAILSQMRQGPRAALSFLRRAIDCDPDDGVAWSNYGLALRDAEMVPQAIEALQRAAELRPHHAQTRVNLASVLLDDGADLAAERGFREALALDPDSVTGRVGLSQALLRKGDITSAGDELFEALRRHPDNALARSALGELQLWSGDFAHGWDNYEARLEHAEMRRFPFPRWNGERPVPGALLVYSEQGIGDMMLFASCLPDVADVEQLIVEAPERLLSIFARSFPDARVVPYAGSERPRWLREVPRITAAISAGSLMRLFRRSPDSFPPAAGYLKADAQRVANWRNRLARHSGRLKVGVSWRGGFSRTGKRSRSVALDDWLPLLSVQDVDFVSLQYTREAAEEIAALERQAGVRVLHWQDAIDDYEETAALVDSLDLVVTVCTAAAHLAGALGKPTWILAPPTPSWRYLGAGESLPWYPSARMFRQRRGEVWSAVIARVADELRDLLPPGVAPTPRTAAATPQDLAAVHPSVPGHDRPTEVRSDLPDDRMRARQLVGEGRHGEAIELLEGLLNADPANGAVYATLAEAYMAAGDREAAADSLTLALHHDPDNVDALWSLCEVNQALGRIDAAIPPLERIVALRGSVKARGALARLYYAVRRHHDAERTAAAVVADHPESGEGLDVLGLARIALEDYEGAIEPLERWVRLRPADLIAPHSLASAYIHRARFDEAEELLSWVLSRQPNNYLAAWNLAHVQLANRRFELGWDNYDRRRHLGERRQITGNFPRWRGEALSGKTLLVLGEQGLGDQIMFASCIGDVLALGANVLLSCERRLIPLFERSFPAVRVLDEATATARDIADSDFEILCGGLPAVFRRGAGTFPRHDGYLRADPVKTERWRQRLTSLGPGPKVGLSWRGGTANTRAKLRSLAVPDLARLIRGSRATFVSLQYGEIDADLRELRDAYGIELLHFPEVIPDYDETAALVAALDHVVSVCTSLVHLTGALGRPCTVLVPSVPEWRYCVAGEDMPWYPSVRLVRQQRDEQWSTVIDRLKSELAVAA